MKMPAFCILFILMTIPLFGQDNPTEVDFIVMRLDYQSLAIKHVYHVAQQVNMVSLTRKVKQFHGLNVDFVPAGDFGGITITSVQTGALVYKATTVWNGTGVHQFPTRDLEVASGDSVFHHEQPPCFYDLADYYFEKDDYESSRLAFIAAVNVRLPFTFPQNSNYGVLGYLHFFTIGMNDPTTAEWIFIFYTLPENVTPYLTHRWIDISQNLPDKYIHTIAPHFFFGDSLWIGTNAGAFHSITGGEEWLPVYLANSDRLFPVSASAVTLNPFVDCLCSVIGLGTTEATVIPEQTSGHVFRSLLDGHDWELLKFPEMSVTALAFNYWNPYTVYAGLFNPLSNESGLYRSKNNAGWEKIECSPGTAGSQKINCITIDQRDTAKIYIGTDEGLFYSEDYCKSWQHQLGAFKIVSIVLSDNSDYSVIYAATGGTGRSDGIWSSYDGGKTFEVLSWETKIVSLVAAPRNMNASVNRCGRFYLAVYGKGVFDSIDGCRSWNPINFGLTEMRVTSLAAHSSKRHQLYLGTENGLFKFTPSSPEIDLSISGEDLAYWPPHPKDGELVEIYATVHNNSPEYIYNIAVSFVDNADGMLTVIVPIDTLVIPAIAPYSDYTLHAEWYPVDQEGENIIHVQVDPLDEIIESNEDNNHAQINIFLETPPTRKWKDITFNLNRIAINDIAAHPFNSGDLYAATDQGAFWKSLLSSKWEQLKFQPHADLKITQIVADPHPYLDWTVPVLWLGTEEYSLIPEDRRGRVLRSEDGGGKWWDAGFKNIAVTAIEALPQNSLNAYVASYNPFYTIDNFYFLKDSTWIGFDLTPGDSVVYRINIIEVHPRHDNFIYVGTDHGLFLSTDGGTNWKVLLRDLNVVSIVFFNGAREEFVYIATSGRSKSDGIYRAMMTNHRWEIVAYFTHIVSLNSSTDKLTAEAAAPHLYLAIYNKGVYETRNGGYNWNDITEDVLHLEMTCLATDRITPDILYLGTKDGVFMYDASKPTNMKYDETPQAQPTSFRIHPNYPNPFNSSTVIRYEIPANLEGDDLHAKIYNTLGQEVKSFCFENRATGVHHFTWDGTDHFGKSVPSGIYFCRVIYKEFGTLIKMASLK